MAVSNRERILLELRARRGYARRAFGDAAQLHDPFGDHVHVGLNGFVHLVKEFVQADEARAFHVPMRLLHLCLQIHGGRQPLVHERIQFGPALF